MARWTVQNKYRDTLLGTIKPENLHFTLELNTPGQIDFEISKVNYPPPDVNDFIGPYRTDWHLFRESFKVDAGLFTSVNGDISDDQVVKIAGRNWLHYLERRHWPFYAYTDWVNGLDTNPIAKLPKVWATTAPDQIVKAMLDALLNIDGYSLDFTYSLDAMPYTIGVYEIGLFDTESIYSKIQTLAKTGFDPSIGIDQGFDFEITPAKVFRLHYPHKGNPLSPIFDFFKGNDSILGLDFTNTGPDGTHAVAIGAGYGVTVTDVLHFPSNSAEFRRHDIVVDVGEVKDVAQLRRNASDALILGAQPIHEISLEVNANEIPNFWVNFQPGRFVYLNYDMGFHHIQSIQRIVKMDCTITNEGEEFVTLGFNQWYDTSIFAPGHPDP